MIDLHTEKCRACTLKHLSAALTALDDVEDSMAPAYYCGNLVHAANHFLRYDQQISNQIRQLRLDSQDEYLNYRLPLDEIKSRLKNLIQVVVDFKEPVKTDNPPAQPVKAPTPTKTAGGCGCRKK